MLFILSYLKFLYLVNILSKPSIEVFKVPPKVTSKDVQQGIRQGYRGLAEVVSSTDADVGRQKGVFIGRATAPLDWFKTYANGGAMNKDAKMGYNRIYRRVK